ncbi:molecular chaperone (small heat shock protein) [Levilactobacillus namurensis DSM 19117]|uniref:Molecular chaperone (Small heat shock protein) n=1 Tax=Levilactobacillus namurensis DSM 19117 TaxID=1423773 RepID=A0A0R1KBV9_9LACO|nr:Hsp20/alpha crystallin family protein [Levilactobacillus namurensis]PTM22852.1 Hsp20/alpha crystallin family protein [Lactobacillus sp. PFC-70]KRK77266.1 molecular chaperone (small heat shock protein) [Levilactobacillus namurensis DSM 19117]MCW3778347.1 Hsp20/alpha crystallin family protein [Levilactobacillus namurensis]MDT7019681.1 Hsp20/alpha crystallin family protein [Levilactobacillus namurensis]WNN65729.1 Hsp20/alpha crystallin family protein [Levilactobacillus namurensis]
MTNEMMNRNDDLFNPMNFFNEVGNLGRDLFNGNDNPMKTDVVEHDKDYVVTAEMPGFKKDDIHVDYRDETLRISGSTNVDQATKDDQGRILRQERSSQNVSRAFYLPNVDLKKVNATYTNGILTLTLPKEAESEDHHKISID